MIMKVVSIYFSRNGYLIFVPCYEYDGNMVEGGKYYKTNDKDEGLIMQYLKASFLESGGILKIRTEETGVELAQGISGWTKAVKNLMLISLKYIDSIGIFFELNKRSGGGFAGYKRIMLGSEFNEAAVCKKLLEIIRGEEYSNAK